MNADDTNLPHSPRCWPYAHKHGGLSHSGTPNHKRVWFNNITQISTFIMTILIWNLSVLYETKIQNIIPSRRPIYRRMLQNVQFVRLAVISFYHNSARRHGHPNCTSSAEKKLIASSRWAFEDEPDHAEEDIVDIECLCEYQRSFVAVYISKDIRNIMRGYDMPVKRLRCIITASSANCKVTHLICLALSNYTFHVGVP